MNKIIELVKNNELTSTLIKNKKFSEEAKKLFKDEGINLSDSEFESALRIIENSLREVKKANSIEELNIDELAEVSGSGGVAKKVGYSVLKVTTTLVCAGGGFAVGSALGATVGTGIGVKSLASIEARDGAEIIAGKIVEGVASPIYFCGAGGAAGAIVGGVLGNKLGNAIISAIES